MRRILFLLTFGLGGLAILLWLGFWQVQRLDWKRDILDLIQSRIDAPAVSIPADPNEDTMEYGSITAVIEPYGPELHVLSSGTGAGTGYRVIRAAKIEDGRSIMVDFGVLPLEAKDFPPFDGRQEITGNLLWPDDKNDSTPAPDLGRNIWFARNVTDMAQALGTSEIMVVLRSSSNPDPRLTPVPVDTSGIKNDHREYAITWFLLAAVWAVMTGFFVKRTAARKD